jgi:hypothetical protein
MVSLTFGGWNGIVFCIEATTIHSPLPFLPGREQGEILRAVSIQFQNGF